MVRFENVDYMGVFAHRNWGRKNLPRRLWTYADGNVSFHFPGEDQGACWVPCGHPTKDGFQKWERIKRE